MLDYFSFPTFGLILLGQSIEGSDLLVVGLLILLEGLLSIDNALVLGMLAKRLPKHMRSKALSYGLIGAFVFRVIAILTAGLLLQWTFVKFLGGAYLVFIAVKHLFWESHEGNEEKVVLDQSGNPALVDAETGEKLDIDRENIEIEQRVPIGSNLVTQKEDVDTTREHSEDSVCDVPSHNMALFWKTVIVIELTDIAFAVDSILAAMALAGSRTEKLWVVIAGGILGVILMRFAAALFVRLLDRFPRFETSAYLLVTVIGLKLLADWGVNSDWSFQGQTWLGSLQPTFQWIEETRLGMVHGYEHWLQNSWWPLGMAPHGPEPENPAFRHAPHLLNFHDLRRPEFITFWLTMLLCFGYGFMPRNADKHVNKT